MARLIITVLFLFVRPALAADPWTKAQINQQVAFTVVLAADWAQTRDIKNHPNLHEANPFLGENPSDREIDEYFATAAIGHLAVAHVLPGKWRDAWQYFWIGAEANTVARNYSLGLRIDL